MPDHDSTTGRTETLDDWLKEWDLHGGWRVSSEDARRLVDEIRRLREQNTGLGVRIQQAWRIQERLEDEIGRLRPISEAAQTLLDVLRSDPLLRSGESSIDQLDQWLKHKAAATGALRIALEGS